MAQRAPWQVTFGSFSTPLPHLPTIVTFVVEEKFNLIVSRQFLAVNLPVPPADSLEITHPKLININYVVITTLPQKHWRSHAWDQSA